MLVTAGLRPDWRVSPRADGQEVCGHRGDRLYIIMMKTRRI